MVQLSIMACMTCTNGMAEGIIKQDTRGRMRVTPERRRALLEEFERSAMTGRKFAAWAGIKYTTFSNWLRAWRKAAGTSQPKDTVEKTGGTRWLEAVVGCSKPAERQQSSGAALIVHGPDGMRLEVRDEEQARFAGVLLRHLHAARPC
jgi:transposase-like protein